MSLVNTLPSGPNKQRCVVAAERNDLIHNNPGTAPAGEQQLFRHGTAWPVQSINDIADEFAANGIELNEIYYKVL